MINRSYVIQSIKNGAIFNPNNCFVFIPKFSYFRNDDANKASASKTADATDTIKDRIRKLMDNCPEVSLQNKPRSTEDIIYNIELTLQNNKQKINRFVLCGIIIS